MGTIPESFELGDTRLMKPVCHQKYENGLLQGSMLIQDIDEVSLNKKSRITYFVPNNVALSLSVSKKALINAKKMYIENFTNPEVVLDLDEMAGNRKEMMASASSLVCDYLENIQTSLVFAYTALEVFTNLSIPEDYAYNAEKNSKGISETYDKQAIERWLPLKVKIKNILTDVYKTKKIEDKKWWGNFLNLEQYRNDIIHQKSISHTEFYKDYFKQSIFNVCESPDHIIKFFHDSLSESKQTNPIWPWMEGSKSLPINSSYDSSQFEVVGNMYEGIKKKL